MNRKNFIPLILLAFVPLFSWSQPGFGRIESLCICQDGFGGACIVSTERNEAGEIFHQLYRRKNDGGMESAGLGILEGVENAGFGSISYFDEEFCIEESFDLAHGEIVGVKSYEKDFYDFFILETGREYFYILFCSHGGQWNLNKVEGHAGRISCVDASGFSVDRPVIFFESENSLWMCTVDEKLFPVSIVQVSSPGENVSAFKCFRGSDFTMGLYIYALQEKRRLCFFTYDGRFRSLHEDLENIEDSFDLASSACIEDRNSEKVYLCSLKGCIFISGNTFADISDEKAVDGFNISEEQIIKSELAFLGDSFHFDSGKVFHERKGFDTEIIENARLFVRTSIINCAYYCAFVKDEKLVMYKASKAGGVGK